MVPTLTKPMGNYQMSPPRSFFVRAFPLYVQKQSVSYATRIRNIHKWDSAGFVCGFSESGGILFNSPGFCSLAYEKDAVNPHVAPEKRRWDNASIQTLFFPLRINSGLMFRDATGTQYKSKRPADPPDLPLICPS